MLAGYDFHTTCQQPISFRSEIILQNRYSLGQILACSMRHLAGGLGICYSIPIMAVPKQHRSKSRQGQRRMHIHLKTPAFTNCKKCGTAILPHTVCINCGTYRGKDVIDVLAKLDKKERKQKQKELAAQEAEKPQEQKDLNPAELSK